METTDSLIAALYTASYEDDWRSFRARALTLICSRMGAAAAAWWTRGAGSSAGELTQHPHPFLSQAALATLALPKPKREAVMNPSPTTLAFAYAPAATELEHTVFVNFAGRREPPAPEAFRRVCFHLCESSTLSLMQYVRRDDWLDAMGRANRGSAVMIDSSGAIYAVSARFRALLEEEVPGVAAASGEYTRLPFPLPEDVLGDTGGEFTHATLHLRVTRCGGLYLLHARKPLPLDALSPREQEIARAISNGKTLKSIARQYGIAVSTVANHTTRIYRKLAIYRREDLIELLRMGPGNGR
jgi:DNA-binding CsgD family transcriptional regulator